MLGTSRSEGRRRNLDATFLMLAQCKDKLLGTEAMHKGLHLRTQASLTRTSFVGNVSKPCRDSSRRCFCLGSEGREVDHEGLADVVACGSMPPSAAISRSRMFKGFDSGPSLVKDVRDEIPKHEREAP